MKTSRKLFLILLISIVVVGLDQFTKCIASTNLDPSESFSYLSGVVQIQYSENTGAILGLGANLPDGMRDLIFMISSGIVIFGMLWFALSTREMTLVSLIGSALVIGGGLGNLWDRIFNDGVVIDFMHIGIGSLRTGIFNLADVAIFAGAGLIIIWGVNLRRKQVLG